MTFIPQVWQFDKDYVENTDSDEALGINTINIKTHDGKYWQNNWDKHPSAVSGTEQWAKLVADYAARGITAFPWCVPTGIDPRQEAAMASSILDISPRIVLNVENWADDLFWNGGQENIKPYIERLRGFKPGARITLQYDIRWPESIWLEDWLPYVDDLLSMTYWTDFEQEPNYALQHAMEVMQSYGKPWAWTIPANSTVYPTFTEEEVFVYRRGTMTEACKQLVRNGPERKSVMLPLDKIDNLYNEQIRQAIEVQVLQKKVFDLETLVEKVKTGLLEALKA